MVSYASVLAAAQRIRGSIYRTPVLTSELVDLASGVQCHFKAEHLQRTGSFKMRGASNAVLSLPSAQAKHGFVAHSAGNHGAALAAAAQGRGVPCTIVVPSDTPAAKVQNITRYGAAVVLCEPTQQARVQTAEAEAARMGGAHIVPPYDDPAVIAGQGTIAIELLEELPQLDAILVPVSGGGMLSGIAVAARALKPSVRVIAVEPEGKGLGRAMAEGVRVRDEAQANRLLPTIADAIRTVALGPRCWELARAHVDPSVLSVSDEMLRAALRVSLLEMKQAVEPAGAIALAALLSPAWSRLAAQAEAQGAPLRSVAAVSCGGNADIGQLARYCAEGARATQEPHGAD